MDPTLTEISALQILGTREEWSIPELPDGMNAALLQSLDGRGWVQARAIIMTNQQKYFGDPTPHAPVPMEWASPFGAPSVIGDWDLVFNQHIRDPHRGPPCQVRVSPTGRTELTRQRWATETAAIAFRAKGCQVYPGVILVIHAGSNALVPVEDDVLDEESDRRIQGISVWGAIDEYATGLARVASSDTGRFVFSLSGELRRPSLGVGRVDAWITRADALRSLRQGKAYTFGGQFPLTPFQADHAVEQIGRVVRERAIELLKIAPKATRPSLSKVADEPAPTEESLTEAIQALLGSIGDWRTNVKSASSGAHRSRARAADRTPSPPRPRKSDIRPPALPVHQIIGLLAPSDVAALKQLSGQTEWSLADLPTNLDADQMRCIDALGLVEVWHLSEWVSPYALPRAWGGWESVLRERHVQGDTTKVRLTPTGQTVVTLLAREGSAKQSPSADVPFQKPIKTSRVAEIVHDRSDVVLRRMKNAGKRIGGTERDPVVELDDAVECHADHAKKLRDWWKNNQAE